MMQAAPPVSPSELVQSARTRRGETQAQFAREVGSKQSLISKYESGKVDPPASLVIHCMNILQAPPDIMISEDALVDLVRTKLAGPRNAAARKTVAALVAGLANIR